MPPTPFSKACQNTATSGTNRNNVRNPSAVPINSRRTSGDSVVMERVRGWASEVIGSVAMDDDIVKSA